ncbi:MAG: hypothetical protein EOO59_12090 [Hymenobacter sp.]|nr:MAG: hypothetical protein EOO59_12090 [Hymenobacter sp.]
MRRAVLGSAFPIPGDADKIAQAMLDAVEQHPAPLRLALGHDTYADARAALVARLAAQRELAQSMVQDEA